MAYVKPSKLPDQTGNNGKYLKTDGTNTSWQTATGSGAAWGDITGTLSSQTDLQSALDGKQAAGTYATGTGSANGTNTGDQVISDATISTTDITTNNATSLKHGFLPKLDNTGTKYLRDDGTWQTPTGGSGLAQYQVRRLIRR